MSFAVSTCTNIKQRKNNSCQSDNTFRFRLNFRDELFIFTDVPQRALCSPQHCELKVVSASSSAASTPLASPAARVPPYETLLLYRHERPERDPRPAAERAAEKADRPDRLDLSANPVASNPLRLLQTLRPTDFVDGALFEIVIPGTRAISRCVVCHRVLYSCCSVLQALS